MYKDKIYPFDSHVFENLMLRRDCNSVMTCIIERVENYRGRQIKVEQEHTVKIHKSSCWKVCRTTGTK